MYEKLKYKERAHHLEESEEIVSRTQFQKTGNFSINKGPGEQRGPRGASLIEHSLKAQTVVVSKGRPPSQLRPPAREVHTAESWGMTSHILGTGKKETLTQAEERVTALHTPCVCRSQSGDLLPIPQVCAGWGP